ncbi:hypothetical protein [Clostridium aceticum]|uniref:hypothetical protein n=1 Tax=Clostridium aceticum TaxID=84022 RepID=UPI00130D8F15|nr:hypothetical protein [Clostridium aceticum]
MIMLFIVLFLKNMSIYAMEFVFLFSNLYYNRTMNLFLSGMVADLHKELYKIKSIAKALEENTYTDSDIGLLEELAAAAAAYKNHLLSMKNRKEGTSQVSDLNMKMEKIAEETFLYKPVTTKNYYDGDYLERFSMMRTSDLKSSGVFDLHNKFWQAHEVSGGNIFATIPLALLNDVQSYKLQSFNWYKGDVDVYEIANEIQSKLSKGEMITILKKMFEHFILVREIRGNIFMVLHYKI